MASARATRASHWATTAASAGPAHLGSTKGQNAIWNASGMAAMASAGLVGASAPTVVSRFANRPLLAASELAEPVALKATVETPSPTRWVADALRAGAPSGVRGNGSKGPRT